MANPKRYSEKIKRKDDGNKSGLQLPKGSYNMMDELSMIKPLFEPHFRSHLSHGLEIHAKLEISHPMDESEMQADELADSFMSGDTERSQEVLSRQVPEISKTSETEAVKNAEETGTETTTNEFDSILLSTKGGGSKVDDETKSELEEHTGMDLSSVNIHTGPIADNLNRNINALAFAHGQDIYFRNGQYNPGSNAGRKLLAHEVAHTIQQQNGVAAKIARTEARTERTVVTFDIDISGYKPTATGNDKNSSNYAWSQIFQISTTDAQTYVKYHLSNSDGTTFAGYTDADVAEKNTTVSLHTSDYFEILNRIQGLSNSKEDIDKLGILIKEAVKTSATGMYHWNELLTELKNINKKLYNYTATDIETLDSDYTALYGNSLTWDLNVIEGNLTSKYTNAHYLPYKNKSLLQIAVIHDRIMNPSNEQLLLNDPAQAEDDKPRGRIITITGNIVVMTGFESTYKIYLDPLADTEYQYDWYVMYDPVYNSDVKGNVIHFAGSDTFTHKWLGAGQHKILCRVTHLLGETPVNVDQYFTTQAVYPSSLEFADRQAEADLKTIEQSNIFTDTFLYESQSVGNRIKYIKEFMPTQAPDFVPKYIEADLATTVISDKVREQMMLYSRNDFYQAEEQRKYDAGIEEVKTQDDNPQLKLDIKDVEKNIPDLSSSITSGTFDGATFKTKIIAFYDTLTDWGYKNDLTYTWWTNYVVFSHPFWKAEDVRKLPDTIDASSVGSWSAVLAGYREVLKKLDDFLAFCLKQVNRPEEAEQFAYLSKMGLNTADVYENHPDAITIPAIFYPDAQALSLDAENATGMNPVPANYKAPGYRVFFYLYKSVEDNGYTHKWVLREAGSGYQNEIEAGDGEGVLNDEIKIHDLFQKLDSKIRFPKGVLKYKFPITNTFEQTVTYKSYELITTEPTTLSEWLKGIGIAVGLLALAAVTLGAATPVIASLVIFSSGLMIAGNIAGMNDLAEQGALTTGEIAINLAYIITDLMAALASGAKLLSLAAEPSSSLARFAGKSFITLEKYSLMAGKVSLLVAGADIFNQLTQISEIKDEKERNAAYMRILGHLIVIGLVHIISNKFNWKYEAQWKMRHSDTTRMIEVGQYKYSQATAGKDLAEGNMSVKELTNEMKVNGWDFTKPPPKMVDMGNGEFITLDHRRLIAAHNAGLTEHPCQIVDGKSAIMANDAGRFNLSTKLKLKDYTEVEGLIGRKVDKNIPSTLEPQNYREAAIFRCAKQREMSKYKDFPLTGSSELPLIK
jgi:hypothetical protein